VLCGAELRESFIDQTISKGNGTPIKNIDVVVTAVSLPNGAIETITNYQGVESKIEYLRDAYDEEFKLKSNPDVEIVGFMVY